MKKLIIFTLLFIHILYSQQNSETVEITIDTNPPNAEIFIAGVSKGKTPKTMNLLPGTYDLVAFRSGYQLIEDKIVINANEKLKNFSYKLKISSGELKINVTPSTAIIKINREVIDASQVQVLTPGTYQIEAELANYYPYKGLVEVEQGKTILEKIILNQKFGKLKFAINPPNAECVLSQNGIGKYNWTGLRIFDSIAEGTYDLIAKTKGYKTYINQIQITGDQSTELDIQMVEGNDPPDWMIFVEGGSFLMGSNEGNPDERPVHKVTVSSFYIGKFEVTREFWGTLMEIPYSLLSGDNMPVDNISHWEAMLFCNKLSEKEGLEKAYTFQDGKTLCNFNSNGYRLPTEAEWEYAARGGIKSKGYKYSGSNNVDEVAYHAGRNDEIILGVGSKKPNELGIYDMSGGVWEACWDWYSKDYYKSKNQINPTGPITGYKQVERGGSFAESPEDCRVTKRSGDRFWRSFSCLGLRLVRSK